MKILRKFLIIGLFSFLFIIKANASVDTNFTYTNLQIFENYINSYNGDVQDLVDLINDNLVLPSDINNYDNYMVFLRNMYDNHAVRVYVIRADNLNIGTFSGNNPRYTLILNTSDGNTSYGSYVDLSFNNNYTSFTQGSYNGNSLWWGLMDTSYYSNLGYYLINTNMSSIKYEQPSYATFSFSINGNGEYNLNDEIPLESFTGSYVYNIAGLEPPVEPVNCVENSLGTFTNVSDFSLQVYGISNVLSEHLRGRFRIVGTGNSNFNTSDYVINVISTEPNLVIGEDILGSYSFNCNGDICDLDYDYYYTDDIDTELNIEFKFSGSNGYLNYNYNIYGCNINDSTMSYSYIDNIDSNTPNSSNTSLENSINDNNINGTNSFLNEILSNDNFTQDHGITAIIQAPINFLQTLNNKTCQSIVLPIPYFGNASIPCMSTIYSSKFLDLYNVIKLIINGLLCYRIALSVVMIIKEAKNPNSDKIEVMDL